MTEQQDSYDEIKPFGKDILIRVLDKNTIESSPIIMMEKSDNQSHHYFEVLKVGEKVTEVQQGDTVLINWKNTMIPFMWGSEYLTVTAEDQVDAVIEGQ